LDENEIVFRVELDWMDAFLCVLGIVMGVFLFGGGVVVLLFGVPDTLLFSVFAICAGCSLLGGALAGMGWTDELHLNPHTRTYQRRRGHAPWAKTTIGYFDDLSLALVLWDDPEAGLGSGVTLTWRSSAQPPLDLPVTGDDRAAEEYHKQLAARLGLRTEVQDRR
jgi:hypothetical protein